MNINDYGTNMRYKDLGHKYIKKIQTLDPISLEYAMFKMKHLCAVSEEMYQNLASEAFNKNFEQYYNEMTDFFDKDLPSIGVSYNHSNVKLQRLLIIILDHFYPNRYHETYNEFK